jgi:hypothetical protein
MDCHQNDWLTPERYVVSAGYSGFAEDRGTAVHLAPDGGCDFSASKSYVSQLTIGH